MGIARSFKRENFDVTPEQESNIDCLQTFLNAATRKDTLLIAVDIALKLVKELRNGKTLFLGNEANDKLTKLLLLGINSPTIGNWKYLVEHSHPWKKQLYVKGRKLPAASVWIGMKVNKLNAEEAAENWDLPIEAIHEIIRYCEDNKNLLEMEANEEMRLLEQKGINIEPQTADR